MSDSTVAAPSDTAGKPVLSVDLPLAVSEQLLATAGRKLRETESLLAVVRSKPLSEERQTTVQTVEMLVRAARESLEKADAQQAAGLAHKAWLLAGELAGQ